MNNLQEAKEIQKWKEDNGEKKTTQERKMHITFTNQSQEENLFPYKHAPLV